MISDGPQCVIGAAAKFKYRRGNSQLLVSADPELAANTSVLSSFQGFGRAVSAGSHYVDVVEAINLPSGTVADAGGSHISCADILADYNQLPQTVSEVKQHPNFR